MYQAKALIGHKEPYAQRFEGVWAGYEYTCLVLPYFAELEKGNKLEATKHWECANKLVLSHKDGTTGCCSGRCNFWGITI